MPNKFSDFLCGGPPLFVVSPFAMVKDFSLERAFPKKKKKNGFFRGPENEIVSRVKNNRYNRLLCLVP